MEAVSRTVLEGHIARVIERMKDMRGSIHETAPIGIISMDNWEWPQGLDYLPYTDITGKPGSRRFYTT